MNTLSTLLSALGHSFAWALLHSLWQGLIIYLALFVLLKAIPAASSRVKYNAALAALLLLVLWVGNTWISQYEKLKDYTVFIRESAGELTPGMTRAVQLTPTADGGTSALHFIQSGIDRYFPWVLAIYSIGLLLMIGRLLFDLIQVNRLKNTGTLPDPGSFLAELVQEWADKLGIDRNVQLLLSSRIHVPIMMGVIRPVILLPIATVNNLTEDQLEAILLHELAHIKRFDYLHNIIQAIVETVLFFNPFVWLMSSITRREREHCCDDVVLSCSARPITYATALTNLGYDVPVQGLAQAATGKKGQLFNRIKRIMETNNTNKSYSRPAIVAVVLVAFALSMTMLAITPSFAQKSKRKKKVETTTTSTVVKESVTTSEDTFSKRPVIKISRSSANGKEQDVDVHVSFRSGKNGLSAVDSAELEKAMHEIVVASKDFSNAMASVSTELDAVDWESIKSDIRHALKEVDEELNSDVNMEANVELRKKLEKSRESLEEARKELKAKLVIIREEAAKARAEAADARADIYAKTSSVDGDYFESILKKMDREGLIDREGKFEIEKGGDQLIINGKVQPKSIRDKYDRYLDRKKVTIKGSGGKIGGELYISLDDK